MDGLSPVWTHMLNVKLIGLFQGFNNSNTWIFPGPEYFQVLKISRGLRREQPLEIFRAWKFPGGGLWQFPGNFQVVINLIFKYWSESSY